MVEASEKFILWISTEQENNNILLRLDGIWLFILREQFPSSLVAETLSHQLFLSYNYLIGRIFGEQKF